MGDIVEQILPFEPLNYEVQIERITNDWVKLLKEKEQINGVWVFYSIDDEERGLFKSQQLLFCLLFKFLEWIQGSADITLPADTRYWRTLPISNIEIAADIRYWPILNWLPISNINFGSDISEWYRISAGPISGILIPAKLAADPWVNTRDRPVLQEPEPDKFRIRSIPGEYTCFRKLKCLVFRTLCWANFKTFKITWPGPGPSKKWNC